MHTLKWQTGKVQKHNDLQKSSINSLIDAYSKLFLVIRIISNIPNNIFFFIHISQLFSHSYRKLVLRFVMGIEMIDEKEAHRNVIGLYKSREKEHIFS